MCLHGMGAGGFLCLFAGGDPGRYLGFASPRTSTFAPLFALHVP